MRRFLCLLVVWSATAVADELKPIPGATPETFLGGAEKVRLVKEATVVKVFRIVDAEPKAGSKKKGVMMDEVLCARTPVTVDGAEVRQVGAVLQDVSLYGGALMCDFDPGVIFRFEKGEENLDVVVCFRCHEMMLYSGGKVVVRPFQWAKTKNTFSRGAGRAFVALAKRAFPQDGEIQGLR